MHGLATSNETAAESGYIHEATPPGTKRQEVRPQSDLQPMSEQLQVRISPCALRVCRPPV